MIGKITLNRRQFVMNAVDTQKTEETKSLEEYLTKTKTIESFSFSLIF